MPPRKTSNGELSISQLQTEDDARSCARLMTASEPWITLGRSYEASLDIIQDPSREVYLVRDGTGLAGFLILCLTGAFVGYIQTVCIDPARRRQRLGARRLYERLGYKVVGELTDYIISGHSELLLRKTMGPLAGFSPKVPAGRASPGTA